MKTKEEILLKYTPYIGTEGVTYENILKAMQEVEQQTRDEMFDFINWLINSENLFFPDGKEFWLYFEKAEDLMDDDLGHIMTIDKVFEYWQINIKEK